MYHQHTYVVQRAQGNLASYLYKLEIASDYLKDGVDAALLVSTT